MPSGIYRNVAFLFFLLASFGDQLKMTCILPAGAGCYIHPSAPSPKIHLPHFYFAVVPVFSAPAMPRLDYQYSIGSC